MVETTPTTEAVTPPDGRRFLTQIPLWIVLAFHVSFSTIIVPALRAGGIVDSESLDLIAVSFVLAQLALLAGFAVLGVNYSFQRYFIAACLAVLAWDYAMSEFNLAGLLIFGAMFVAPVLLATSLLRFFPWPRVVVCQSRGRPFRNNTLAIWMLTTTLAAVTFVSFRGSEFAIAVDLSSSAFEPYALTFFCSMLGLALWLPYSLLVNGGRPLWTFAFVGCAISAIVPTVALVYDDGDVESAFLALIATSAAGTAALTLLALRVAGYRLTRRRDLPQRTADEVDGGWGLLPVTMIAATIVVGSSIYLSGSLPPERGSFDWLDATTIDSATLASHNWIEKLLQSPATDIEDVMFKTVLPSAIQLQQWSRKFPAGCDMLRMESTPIEGAAAAIAAVRPQTLILREMQIPAKLLADVSQVSSIRSIRFDDCEFDPKEAGVLPNILENSTADIDARQWFRSCHDKQLASHVAGTKLRYISLGPSVTDVGLMSLLACPQLNVIDAADCQLTEFGAWKFAVLRPACYLNHPVLDQAVSIETLKRLAELPDLRALTLTNSQFPVEKGEWVGDMRELRSLTLSRSPVTANLLVQLSGLTELLHLDLSETRLTATDILQFPPMSSLTMLDLRGISLTEKEMSHLVKQLPNLEVLYCGTVTASCCTALTSFKRLRILEIKNFSDAPDPESLKSVVGIPTLISFDTDDWSLAAAILRDRPEIWVGLVPYPQSYRYLRGVI
jgi:hypothetical protein